MIKSKLHNISHSLHTRLTIWVMLTVLVVFCIITVIITNVIREAFLSSSEENAKSRIEIANQRINSMLVGVEVAVENVIPKVMDNLDNPDEYYAIVQQILELNDPIIGSAIAFEPNYYPKKGVYFSPYAYRTVNGTIETKQLGSSEYEYHSMDWYQIPKLLKKNYWSEPYYDTGGGEQMMTTYSHPLYDKNGNLMAVITADVSLNWLTELVAKSDIELNAKLMETEIDSTNLEINDDFFYTHAYSFIIGRGATYITHPDTERILNDTYFVYSMETNDSIDAQIGYDMVDGLSGMREMIRDGVKYLICYAPIKRTGWSMATVIPAKIIYGNSRLLSYLILFIMLAGLVALFLICNSVVKRITRPLARFADSADEVAKGNLDATLPDIKTKDEMARLSQSFSLMQTSLKQQMEELRQSTASKAAIESELKVASDIQMSMLPKIFPAYPDRDDIDIFGQLTPAKAVGGDLFDFFIRDEKLFFCIGDVSGKGVPAALVMAVTRAQFRTVSAHESQPERIITRLNDTMSEGNDSNMFVTLFVGVLDLPTGRLRYCNAGHDSPLLIGSGIGMLPCDSNLPVGVMGDWKFTMQETQIDPGTTIFLYTDGLTEAENIDHAQFTDERILKVADTSLSTNDHNPHRLVENMTNAVRDFVNGAEQSDDLTMLAIQYTKQQLDVRYQRSITLTNDIQQVPQLAEFIDDVCEAMGFDELTTMQMNLAIEEAVVNVMNYAYPEGTTGSVNIEVQANDARLKFVISDSGKHFDPTSVAEADTTLSAEDRSIGGLGIYLVRQLMDSVNYERIGGFNVLTLRKKLNK
jgi:sigma-B regulation protein RsbU (phosphoserine phosphatase)